jgi:hypothetical protein
MFWRLSKQFATDSNRRFDLHKVIRFHAPRTAKIHLVISILTHIKTEEQIITVQTVVQLTTLSKQIKTD